VLAVIAIVNICAFLESSRGENYKMTTIRRVDAEKPEINAILDAVTLIKNGEVIVYPTDTVYGLGADALNPEAVHRVFEIKGRSPGQPLPVAVSGLEMAETLAVIDDKSRRLIEAFWPGALTIILAKKPIMPSIVVGKGLSVGLRMPNHAVPLMIMQNSGLPLIATSANKHGMPSSVEVGDALRQIGSEVKLALDCGRLGGTPSTVIDLTKIPSRITRSGAVTREMIGSVIGDVDG
jgi:L-threonylcarbamoyladenylate synthase